MRVSAAANSVSVTVDPEVYPLDVIYAASNAFADRAFVSLDRDTAADEAPSRGHKVRVTLTARQPSVDTDLRSLGGEFMNELLAQALRESVAEKTKSIRELVVRRALDSSVPDRES